MRRRQLIAMTALITVIALMLMSKCSYTPADVSHSDQHTTIEQRAAESSPQPNKCKNDILTRQGTQYKVKSIQASFREAAAADETESVTESSESVTETPDIVSEVPGSVSDTVKSVIPHTPEEEKILAYMIQRECGPGNYEHKTIIVQIVANRVRSPAFPDTIAAVLYQTGQFQGIERWATDYPHPDKDSLQAVSDVLAGIAPDNSRGAIYYYAPAYVDDIEVVRWFNSQEFLFEAGGHRFYK